MSQAMHTGNGQVQIASQYVIEALRQDNANLREHNLQLHAMLLQVQGEAHKEITALQSQLKRHQDAEQNTVLPEAVPTSSGE